MTVDPLNCTPRFGSRRQEERADPYANTWHRNSLQPRPDADYDIDGTAEDVTEQTQIEAPKP